MTLTMIVAAIVLAMIVLVGGIGFWIDEDAEPLEPAERPIAEHPRI